MPFLHCAPLDQRHNCSRIRFLRWTVWTVWSRGRRRMFGRAFFGAGMIKKGERGMIVVFGQCNDHDQERGKGNDCGIRSVQFSQTQHMLKIRKYHLLLRIARPGPWCAGWWLRPWPPRRQGEQSSLILDRLLKFKGVNVFSEDS